MPIFKRAWVLCLFITFSNPAFTNSNPFQMQKVSQGLGVIWAMDFIDDSQLIFTQRSGEAGIVNLSSGSVSWLQGLPNVHASGQGGLLDVAVPPDYKESGWVYFTYSKPGFMSSKTTLARAKLAGKQLESWQDLLVTESASIRDIHYGSRIAFDGKGHLFFTVGDRGNTEDAQNLSNHAGTVIRLNMDGSVPADNPFINVEQALPEIWSYGHRNPQGLHFDPQTGLLWEIEHGPRGGDEINLVEKGKNYGWPTVSQGREYFSGSPVGVRHKEGMAEPSKVYIPSIAPSDLLLYRGQSITAWQGHLLTGALKLTHLNVVAVNKQNKIYSEKRFLEPLRERVRSLATNSVGDLFVGTDSGYIYQLSAK